MSRDPRMRSAFRDRVDARAQLAYLGAVLLLAFTIEHPVYLAALTCAVWAVLVALVDGREYRPYLGYGAFAAIGIMLINPLVSRAGDSVLWVGPTLPIVGPMTVSAEAIVYGIGMGLRLLCVIAVFALYSTLVDPDALYRLISPVSLGSALVVALSIRLFPATVRDTQRITDAQRSRGLALDAGSVSTRVRARVPVLDALLTTSLDRAMNLAEALETRGFGRPGRSRLAAPALSPTDRIVLALSAACAVLGVGLAASAARFAYYPQLPDPARPLDLALAVGLAALVAFPLALEGGRVTWLSSRSIT